jgi:hypothetical protein
MKRFKMGRMEEAKMQHARVLRKLPDMAQFSERCAGVCQ